ncbi:MAG: hypothetical protein GY952_03210 [Rhodobacteraceae bacterium]|nr:hypothetical protein [Paracoccaceae bacterium]
MLLFQRILKPARLILAFLSLIITVPTPATADYLDDQEMFRAAWSKLLNAVGDTDLYLVHILPEAIGVQAPASGRGFPFGGWNVERRKGLLGTRDKLSGPVEIERPPLVPLRMKGLFAQSELDFDRLPELFEVAKQKARLRLPGEISEVLAIRNLVKSVTAGKPSEYGALRWVILVVQGREQAPVAFDADGVFLGVDISRTSRGLLRDLRTQPDWPFDEAVVGFSRHVGDGEVVYGLTLSKDSLIITAAAGEDGEAVDFKWDGGMVTGGHGNISAAIRGQQPQATPFALADAHIERLPEFLATASAAAPEGWRVIARVEAAIEQGEFKPTELVWSIELMQPKGFMGERVAVRVRPDGSVASVVLPDSLRPSAAYLSHAGALAAIDEFQAALGADAAVYELMLRDDRVTLLAPDPENASRVAEFQLGKRGLRRGMGRPKIIESEADLFALSRAATFHPDILSAAKKVVLSSFGAAGAEVFMVKMWSGAPFWSSPDGGPVLRMNVGVPPNHSNSGYVIFTLGGDVIASGR